MNPVVIFESHDPRRKERSFRFLDFRSEVRTNSPEGVLPALASVEDAVAHGQHAAGFISYEAAAGIDPAFKSCLDVCPDGRKTQAAAVLPLVWFGIYGAREEFAPHPEDNRAEPPELHWQPSIARETYARGIGRIHTLIAAGETYQVNFTYRLRARFECSPWAYYRRMCEMQKAAYCAFIDLGSHKILSASPELFFKWEPGLLVARPMKGTARRGRYWDEDEAAAAALHLSGKNRAENLMIVDMMRSDMGRIAETGSIAVPHLFEIERYETVLQMTSTIAAAPRPGTSLCDIFRALFPSGSVTGAPKIRTMEIIGDLEREPRGIYTGAIGFLSPGPEAVFSVAIRTVMVDEARRLAEFGVGGGITYDSSAQGEYDECIDKARFLNLKPRDFELLETMLLEPSGEYFLMDRHLARLEGSARYFAFSFDREAAISALNRHMSSLTPASYRVRLTLGRTGAINIESAAMPACATFSAAPAVIDYRYPADNEDPFFYNKTTNRKHYQLVMSAYPPQYHVIMTNREGRITESVLANVVIKCGNALYTPPVEDGLLPGVFRAELLERGEIGERSLMPEDLIKADAVYLINSVRRWVPVYIAEARGFEANGKNRF